MLQPFLNLVLVRSADFVNPYSGKRKDPFDAGLDRHIGSTATERQRKTCPERYSNPRSHC